MPEAQPPATALFRRLFGVTALVLVAGTLALAFAPVTVSSRASVNEAVVLLAGLVVLLAANAVLLRRSLRPLDGLTVFMEHVDLLRPGDRLPVRGHGYVARVIRTFNAMLDRLEAERGTSSKHALAAQEGERARIARELHDEIGQTLTAVLLTLKRTVDRAPEDLRPELCLVQETVRGSLDEVRQVARRLRPGVLEDLGLVSAVTALTTDFTDATRVPVRRWLGVLPALSHEVELVLYRTAQEALTNVARHAGASQVDLTLTRTARGVRLRVTDDGRGLDDAEDGAGIRGMRERALLIGALLSIGPGPDGGTEITLDVDL
jgi:two-component system, NarL family, sensor histidine kinase UhpB